MVDAVPGDETLFYEVGFIRLTRPLRCFFRETCFNLEPGSQL